MVVGVVAVVPVIGGVHAAVLSPKEEASRLEQSVLAGGAHLSEVAGGVPPQVEVAVGMVVVHTPHGMGLVLVAVAVGHIHGGGERHRGTVAELPRQPARW